MALLFRGKTTCGICGRIIDTVDRAVMFPPLTANELDPLIGFSDQAFHQRCFCQHPLKAQVEARFQEMIALTGPGHRNCVVCRSEILDPDDYFTVGHVTDDQTHPLYRFNFTQLHRSCIRSWTDAGHFCRLLLDLSWSGKWKGTTLSSLLAMIDAESRK